MRFVEDDGGRSLAGFKGTTGDCVTRAIAIATGKPYREVYDALHDGMREFATGRSKAAKCSAARSGGTSPRNGVHRKVYESYLLSLGWTWTPTMKIGSGCTTHLRAGELPGGRLVVRVSKHVTAVIDGEVHDTYDPSYDGTRCVYGYYSSPAMR